MRKWSKSSILAGVLLASCVLASQAVLAEEADSEINARTELLQPQADSILENTETSVANAEMKAFATEEGEANPVATPEEAATSLNQDETGAMTEETSTPSTEEQTAAAPANLSVSRQEAVQTEAPVLNMVDSQASQETKELFDYLREKAASPDVLFGQQHALDEGVTLTGEGSRAGSTESEVKNAVGDYPAVFGWDTLSLDGHEKPGVEGDPEQSLKNVITSMKTAHELGGIIVLSMHPYNFVTGGSFNDTSGNVVNEILPGGSKNTEFNQWLDRIAELAHGLKDEDGKDIPLLFRPFHEQTGSWFWWGESSTKTDQYKAVYRYTVEYLRDTKKVHNILYVYSPNITAPGDQERYLATYPGDDYVDIFGIDSYDSKANAGSDQFLSGLVKDLSMIVDLAEQKGKIAALTEFGYSAQGIKETGNTLDWYSRIFNTIQSHKKASKIAYMLTWANFGAPSNLYVPYRDVNGNLGGNHELLPDFENFYKHANTVFAKEVGQIYGKGKNYQTAPTSRSSYLIRPASSDIIRQQDLQVLVKAGQDDDAVTFAIGGQTHTLTKEGDYYTAKLTLPSEWDNQALMASLQYISKGQVIRTEDIKLFTRFKQVEESPFVLDTFENYFGDDSLLNQAYSANGDKIQISLTDNQKQGGQYGMVYDYEVGDLGYAGRQLSFEKNWQGANALTFWLKHSGYPQQLTVQIRIGNVSYEKNINLKESFEGLVTLPLADFLPASWEGSQAARVDQSGLAQVSQFALYLGGEKGKGTLYIDDIQAITDKNLPAIVDKYDPAEKPYQPTIYSFDQEVGDWTGPDLAVSEGQLVARVSGTKDQKTEIYLQANQDLSDYNWYVVKLKADSPLQARLYVKVGDNWQWFNNETATVADQWTTLRFDLSGIANRSKTREIGIEFIGQGGTEQVLVQIDQISLVKDLKEMEEAVEAPKKAKKETADLSLAAKEIRKGTDEPSQPGTPRDLLVNELSASASHTESESNPQSKRLPQTGQTNQWLMITLGVVLLAASQLFRRKRQ